MAVSTLNVERYKHLSRYLSYVPNGVDSYPLAQTRADFSKILREKLGSLLSKDELPPEIYLRLVSDWKQVTVQGPDC